LVIGVASAHATHANILVAGSAGLMAGPMSMAAGEYVSVHSQADTENADLELEKTELKANWEGEHQELAAIYVARGVEHQVAQQSMSKNAFEAHARDELGITETLSARPIQAALVSALSFAMGAAVPLIVANLTPSRVLILFVSTTSLICLVFLGGERNP
jgi:VIT1/CCC1 family predicted Fe2+/Mn2+ transporter